MKHEKMVKRNVNTYHQPILNIETCLVIHIKGTYKSRHFQTSKLNIQVVTFFGKGKSGDAEVLR